MVVDERLAILVETGLDHRSPRIRCGLIIWLALVAGLFCMCTLEDARAGVTGSVSGIVTDESGAVVVGAEITARAVETGLQRSVHTDDKGFYSLDRKSTRL